MPKMKTHKGAARRFKVTATGKIMRMKGHRSHLRRNKAPRFKRTFDKMMEISPSDVQRVRRLLPYGA